MCWNQYVSLNTYLFSMGMLFLMIYNNNYTPYKVNIGTYGYLFILSFCSMQLIEYFLWKNINDKKLNYFYSILGQALIGLQPIISLLLLTNTMLKILMILLYVIFAVIIFFTHDKIFKTSIKDGHLKWSWIPVNYFVQYIWLFFFLFSFIVNKYYSSIAVALFLFAITYYTSSETGGSLWCWTANFTLLFYAMYLLIIAPFNEISGC
jgi:hypothetical protein